jgi:hypothetical protein
MQTGRTVKTCVITEKLAESQVQAGASKGDRRLDQAMALLPARPGGR